ncbi:61.0 kDa protein [Pineapple mealybug wilt-associated virus 3]|uniref:61.0 kDa protein n=1 Tax=Pineapple mealybug wilt-associated virus 3 TaxID=373861 RepID=B2KIT7_9CLOS|nr:61.0 kDa protein [Pineapple mealybug wilt-associated virus 3]ABD62351.1 61.0 kDa protein [Pineapple mealybug wilt-associated virus 3]
MALSATSAYVLAVETDKQYLDLLRTFYGKSDVAVEAKEIFEYLKQNYPRISGRLSIGTYVANTWWQISPGGMTAGSDSEGWARHLLGNYIVSKNLLAHMYYNLQTEIRAALATLMSVFHMKTALVDVPVTQSTVFNYKVTRTAARSLARELPGEETHLTDLIFCIGNYLGHLPNRSQVIGEVPLPVAAVRRTVNPLEISNEYLSNEVKLGVLNMMGKTKIGDPIEGVRYKLEAVRIKTICETLFLPEDIDLCSKLPAVQYIIAQALDSTDTPMDTFEDRVESDVLVGAKVRSKLQGLLRFREEEDLNVLLAKAAIRPNEMTRGDGVVVRARYEKNVAGRSLLRVGSPFSQEQYSLLTARLVRALLLKNPTVDMNYAEAVITLLQRYIHYRTNPLRFVNLPVKIQMIFKGKIELIDYSAVDRVFAQLQNSFPEVERAWCAPLATVAYFILRDSGGSFAKWRDLCDVPPVLNFDFVGYVDPRVLSNSERKHLARIVHRFRTANTPVRGFKIDNRLINPIDYIYDGINMSTSSRSMHRSLLNR